MSRLTSQARSVSDALETRFSCRAFLDKPVPEDDIRYILQTALRAPSGGNLQPWHVWVVQGAQLAGFVDEIKGKMTDNPGGEGRNITFILPIWLIRITRAAAILVSVCMRRLGWRAKTNWAVWRRWPAISNFLARPAPCSSRLINPCRKGNGRIWV